MEELEARSKGREHPHVPGAWHQGWKKCREALRKVTEQAQEAGEERMDSKRGGRDRRERPWVVLM